MKAIVWTNYGSPDVLQLEQIAEAHRYVDTGQKKGSVVIPISQ